MNDYQALNDPQKQRLVVQRRVLSLGAVLFVLCSALLLRYHSLQIEQFDKYATLSDENRVHVRPIPPTRGLIFDRNGKILAENRPSYTLSIIRERADNIDTLVGELDHLLDLDEAEIERFEQQRSQYRRAYEGIPLRFQLTEEDVALLAVNQFRLPGIEVEVELVRHYPFNEKFAHTVGYVGRINDREEAVLDAERYEGTHVIGKIGIEKQYEDILHGEVGYEYVETDVRGNILRVLERQDAIPGKDLHLNLDSNLQLLLFDLLKGRRASTVALDVETGEVLAMVSTPSYDANLFVTGISFDDYNQLLNNVDRPLYDRSLLGQYPPGSTIKPLYALAGLASGTVTPEFEISDNGEFSLNGQERIYRDWKKGGHGVVDIRIAIEQSCDVYFYELGRVGGIDLLSEYGDMFGLGKRTGIDMPSERSGIMPSRNWKRGARGIAWYPGDTINTSIGQGFTLATPLQLAHMTANMAREGVNIQPHMINTVGEGFDKPIPEIVADISNEHWEVIRSAMEDVVHSARGTASAQGRNISYRMAGKTGTAQVVGIAQDAEYNSEELEEFQRDHALWISFAPADAPKIAVAVVVENGEHGSSTAAPVAKMLTDKWFELNPHLLNPNIVEEQDNPSDDNDTPMETEGNSLQSMAEPSFIPHDHQHVHREGSFETEGFDQAEGSYQVSDHAI